MLHFIWYIIPKSRQTSMYIIHTVCKRHVWRRNKVTVKICWKFPRILRLYQNSSNPQSGHTSFGPVYQSWVNLCTWLKFEENCCKMDIPLKKSLWLKTEKKSLIKKKKWRLHAHIWWKNEFYNIFFAPLDIHFCVEILKCPSIYGI